MAQGKANVWGTTIIEGKVIGQEMAVVPPDQVEELAGIGCSNKEIAAFYGVKDTALTRNFAEQLTKGREGMKQRLRKAQLTLALTGNATMLIWLGKNILGQTDTPQSVDSDVLPWSDEEEKEELIDELEDELNDLNATE